MSVNWIDVADTTVKIGLGSLITTVSSYFVLSKTHSHDDKKEARKIFYKQQNERKAKFSEFLAQYQGIVQKSVFSLFRSRVRLH